MGVATPLVWKPGVDTSFSNSLVRGDVLGLYVCLPRTGPVTPTKNKKIMLVSGELVQGASRPRAAVSSDTAFPPYVRGIRPNTPSERMSEATESTEP